MTIFQELQEITKKMDEKHSSNKHTKPIVSSNVLHEEKLSYEERERLRKKKERRSCILLFFSGLGLLVILYLFIRLYIVVGDYVFNSSFFETIAVVGFIGIALYLLFLLGSLIYGSFSEAKASGGRSILALVIFLIVVAVGFTLMSKYI